jgi:hypothetical protein
MEHNEQKSIKNAILEKIGSSELHMHSKYYFYLRIVALVAVSAATFLVSIFILNFILFSIRINSDEQFLFMGPIGWGAFVQFFPWHLLALDVVLVGALLWLLRQFKFGYRSPLLFLLLGIFFFTLGAGFVVDRTTGINEHFLREAEGRRLAPPFGDAYRGVRHERPGFPEPIR